ncbi:MAG TPA: LysR family transcriptional regulator [Aliiroseovarius sp.]|nr:LysR family transcriptional regulator [Aliiroseovarius sp.]
MSYINNIKMFVRVFELGSMSAAARDQRCSPAVASSRIADLERHLGVRLFNRTTRALHPTENGRIFYEGACKVLDTVAEAEAALAENADNPRGSVFVAAGLGVGRRFIAPALPEFKKLYPNIDIRLRLSDRSIDLMAEGLDLMFHLGDLADSSLKIRVVANCPRILCAAPSYVKKHGNPGNGAALISENHACLALRFPGSKEFLWTLETADGPRRFSITGPYESDDGDVLTEWALAGHGIVMKPVFEIASYLQSGELVQVAKSEPPLPTQLSCLTPHRKMKDSKVGLFTDFMIPRIKQAMAGAEGLVSTGPGA